MGATGDDIRRAVETLLGGGVVAFPTDTVYGLGALATDEAAVRRIFEMKARPPGRPLIVHVDGPAGLDVFAVEAPEYARKLAAAFWPGPLTLVLRRAAVVPDVVTAGGDTVGLRVPDHPVALALIAALGKRLGRTAGIAAPSANRFGEPPPTDVQGVVDSLGAPGSGPRAPDLVLDGGTCPGGVPSTVLACEGEWPRVLRRGSISPEQIEAIIGRWVDD